MKGLIKLNCTKITDFNGTNCISLCAGGYSALIAYEIGSNVIRLHDDKNNIEFFRFKKDNSADTIRQSAEVWGLPTLYLPNRFADGVIKTSDAVYNLPVNEKAPYNNHIHGFLHKRIHKLVEHGSDEKSAWARTSYLYDENDDFFKYLPVKFLSEYTFTLSENGLRQDIKFTNLSDKMMPMSLASHTTINSPFVYGSKETDIRLTVPAGKKCELNSRCLPTENLLELTDYDREYLTGKQSVLVNIDNDMYTADYKDFHGIIAEDISTGKKICYEVSEQYKFWIIWNDKGFNGYFCPEPMTAMINAPNLLLDDKITGYCEVKPNESFETYQRFFTRI